LRIPFIFGNESGFFDFISICRKLRRRLIMFLFLNYALGQRNTPATRGRHRRIAPGRGRRRAAGRDRAANETEACVSKTAVTILSYGRVETMARTIPDGICRGTGPCPSQQGAKKTHAAGPVSSEAQNAPSPPLSAPGTIARLF
jgi:hypothetical protein